MKIYKIAGKLIPLYRGENAYNKGGNYYSIDKEWARQFTQSGQYSEIKTINFPYDAIYIQDPLPHATDETEFDNALNYARKHGYRAFMLDEGVGEANSVFIFGK